MISQAQPASRVPRLAALRLSLSCRLCCRLGFRLSCLLLCSTLHSILPRSMPALPETRERQGCQGYGERCEKLRGTRAGIDVPGSTIWSRPLQLRCNWPTTRLLRCLFKVPCIAEHLGIVRFVQHLVLVVVVVQGDAEQSLRLQH